MLDEEDIELDEEEELEEEEELDELDDEEEELDREEELEEEEELDELDKVDEVEEEKTKVSVKPKDKQENLRKQLEMIPTKGTSFYMANRFYYNEQNYDEAIKMYKAAMAEESDELILAKSLYYMSESYVKLKELSEAISVFEDLIGRLPGHYLAANA